MRPPFFQYSGVVPKTGAMGLDAGECHSMSGRDDTSDIEALDEVSDEQIEDCLDQLIAGIQPDGKRLLLVVPDGTRSIPLGRFFRPLHDRLSGRAGSIDLMVALGTHAPMPEEAICDRLGINVDERAKQYSDVRFHNHEWDNPRALTALGNIPAERIHALTNGLFAMDVPVTVNRIVHEVDHIIIVGPVFPHEVVGFSGGNKYLFPGISGPEVLNFFHWLGAVITCPRIIGRPDTPVRAVIDDAASMIPTPVSAVCAVVDGSHLRSVHAGTVVESWRAAASVSGRVHIRLHDLPYRTVLACAPQMYDELWVGGKCMYKLEGVVADGGELIIYAPHIRHVSKVHGNAIGRIGYHVRDFFLKQWDRYESHPWGVLAHSTHVRGVGSFDNGIEHPRIQVTLATGIDPDTCARIGLGYRNPSEIAPAAWIALGNSDCLVVEHAGEVLHRLRHAPDWAR